MKTTRFTYAALASVALAALSFSGCKGSQQLQNQVADMDAKVADAQRKITALETEVQRTHGELAELKGLVTKLGNVTVDLQTAEEARQKAGAEARAKSSHKKTMPIKKPAAGAHKKKK